MKDTILVVDDDKDVLPLLVSCLKQEGYEPITAENGEQGLARARADRPDLVILDIILPLMSGFEVCRILKGNPATEGIPVIMLTGRHEGVNCVAAFEAGADDCVTKPFSPRELALRVKSHLRRPQAGMGAVVSNHAGEGTEGPAIVKAGPIELDRGRHEARVEGRPVGFSPAQFRLLSVLVQHAGEVYSREKLLSEAWGCDNRTEARAVDVQVLRLREKLGNAADCLQTVHGSGYRLTPRPGGK